MYFNVLWKFKLLNYLKKQEKKGEWSHMTLPELLFSEPALTPGVGTKHVDMKPISPLKAFKVFKVLPDQDLSKSWIKNS